MPSATCTPLLGVRIGVTVTASPNAGNMARQANAYRYLREQVAIQRPSIAESSVCSALRALRGTLVMPRVTRFPSEEIGCALAAVALADRRRCQPFSAPLRPSLPHR